MKIKVSGANNHQLNYLVAKCVGGYNIDETGRPWDVDKSDPNDEENGASWFNPTTNWAHGGPIVEREWDNLLRWFYLKSQKESGDMWPDYMFNGQPVLKAFMQAYVALTLSDEVEVPEELA